jgi:hypothetical protein
MKTSAWAGAAASASEQAAASGDSNRIDYSL